MFGKRNKNQEEISEETYERSKEEENIEVGHPTREDRIRFSGLDIVIMVIAAILIASIVLLFSSVVPEMGWESYLAFIHYAWKPLSWMPLWVFLAVIIIGHFINDMFERVIISRSYRVHYLHVSEENHVYYFWTLRSLGKHYIAIEESQVYHRGMMYYHVAPSTTKRHVAKNIILETSLSEVTNYQLGSKRETTLYLEIEKLHKELKTHNFSTEDVVFRLSEILSGRGGNEKK